MTKIPNKENVKKIIMRPIAYTKCQIGQDWFLNRFEVNFLPGDYYPDYMEVQKFIQSKIEGREMNIEVATKSLYDFLSQYNPAGLEIIDHIEDCNTHFDVDVII